MTKQPTKKEMMQIETKEGTELSKVITQPIAARTVKNIRANPQTCVIFNKRATAADRREGGDSKSHHGAPLKR